MHNQKSKIENHESAAPLRCPRCQYNLTALRSDACPECGLDEVVRRAALHRSRYRRWLHLYAIFFVLMTGALLVLGGTVTSKGVGLAVPDWPTTFEYNMFLFPPSMWTGGVFWEHTHRLMGALVGVMTIIMAAWLWLSQKHRPWLRWFGVATLGMVIAQGVMGGLRVTELSFILAIFHGVTAQLFLCMTVLIAAATSKWWLGAEGDERSAGNAISHSRAAARVSDPSPSKGEAGRGWAGNKANAADSPISRAAQPLQSAKRLPLTLAYVLFAVILVQLILGAAMRHTGSGLAIPDFPKSFGQWTPPLTQAEINAAIADMPYDQEADIANAVAALRHDPADDYFKPWRVGLHFAHRAWAVAVLLAAAGVIVAVLRRAAHVARLTNPALLIALLLIVQVALGAATIWTVRHPEFATAHQTLGAVTLAMAALLILRLHRVPVPAKPAREARRVTTSESPAAPTSGARAPVATRNSAIAKRSAPQPAPQRRTPVTLEGATS